MTALSSASWKRLNSAHYRAIRAAFSDHRNRISRKDLDKRSARATPVEWASYITASTVIKLYNKSDTNIATQIRDAAYINDRMPGIAKFIDKSRLKIGKQTLTNRIGPIFSATKFGWISLEDDNKLRRQLKETFFKFSNIHN